MSWLLPVGTPGGVNAGFDGLQPGSGIVRLGDQMLGLDFGVYRLWRAATAVPQTEQLITWGTANGIPDVAGHVHALTDAGLLVEDGLRVQHQIGRLALRLVGECLGNGADPSPVFLVLGRNDTTVQVDAFLFQVLLRSDGVSPLSVICDALDAAQPEPGHRRCLAALTEGLPLLVRNEVVRLEGAVR